MKLVSWEMVLDQGFGDSREFRAIDEDVRTAINGIKWPIGNDLFTIRGESGRKTGEGNGVKPIKDAFIECLKERDWEIEPKGRRFDALREFTTGHPPFAVEWETGNISSSHRSINRLALAMLMGEISGGVLVVPSRAMYKYLTDRVGNFSELEPYLPLWRMWNRLGTFGYLAIVTVEHDAVSNDVPRISKGTDGRAII